MKLLFAECCGDLIVPASYAHSPRWCRCGSACCWWREPLSGLFSCYSIHGEQKVSILGINNSLLYTEFPKIKNEGKETEFGAIQRNAIQEMIEQTPDHFLFKQMRSMIVRFRPGFTNDTKFEEPPKASKPG